jgi:hypothetical protein
MPGGLHLQEPCDASRIPETRPHAESMRAHLPEPGKAQQLHCLQFLPIAALTLAKGIGNSCQTVTNRVPGVNGTAPSGWLPRIDEPEWPGVRVTTDAGWTFNPAPFGKPAT